MVSLTNFDIIIEEYLAFEEAIEYVRGLNLLDKEEWISWDNWLYRNGR